MVDEFMTSGMTREVAEATVLASLEGVLDVIDDRRLSRPIYTKAKIRAAKRAAARSSQT